MSGWSAGRPFISKIRATASARRRRCPDRTPSRSGSRRDRPRAAAPTASSRRGWSACTVTQRDGIEELERRVDEVERLRRREVVGPSQDDDRASGSASTRRSAGRTKSLVADGDQHGTGHRRQIVLGEHGGRRSPLQIAASARSGRCRVARVLGEQRARLSSVSPPSIASTMRRQDAVRSGRARTRCGRSRRARAGGTRPDGRRQRSSVIAPSEKPTRRPVPRAADLEHAGRPRSA
jgi:hypothetical protein